MVKGSEMDTVEGSLGALYSKKQLLSNCEVNKFNK